MNYKDKYIKYKYKYLKLKGGYKKDPKIIITVPHSQPNSTISNTPKKIQNCTPF